MATRSSVYVVPTNERCIERIVWLIAGVMLLASTVMALLVNRLWILVVTPTGLVSIDVALTGFCPVGSMLRWLGFPPMLGAKTSTPSKLYLMQIDKRYLERRIYLFVGINVFTASLLVFFLSAWVTLATIFVGGAMVWFAVTGFRAMANGLYWLGAEPRLNPNRCLPVAALNVQNRESVSADTQSWREKPGQALSSQCYLLPSFILTPVTAF